MPIKKQNTDVAKVKKLSTYINNDTDSDRRRCLTTESTECSSVWVEYTRLDCNSNRINRKTSTPATNKYGKPTNQPRDFNQLLKQAMKQRKLYIVCDYSSSLIYGDLNVRQGDMVNLICESGKYYFVEAHDGRQGFIPCYICVDLDEVVFNAHAKQYHHSKNKVTSL
jgi:hypothetical protein